MGKVIDFSSGKEITIEDKYIPNTVFVEAVYDLLYQVAKDDKDVTFILNSSMDALFDRKYNDLVEHGVNEVEALFKATELVRKSVDERFTPLD